MFIPLRNLFFCVRSEINLKLYRKFMFVYCGFVNGFWITCWFFASNVRRIDNFRTFAPLVFN